MAAAGEEEVEYESDPEEAKRLLTMRRREASDDEEGEGEERERIDSRAVIESDVESEGEGAPEEYEDDDEESVIEEEEYNELDEEEVEAEEDRDEVHDGEVAREVLAEANQVDGERERSAEELAEVEGGNQVEEGKKENEPFAVPTAGAFYMHDDRFRNNAGGRNRRTLGGRKLWESRDDRKWGHDKFEEMSLQERHYDEGTRNSRGRFRGRGKNQGPDRGYPRGNKAKFYDNYNQNQVSKSVRGRGPRRYDSVKKNSEAAPTQYRQRPGKSVENTSHAVSGRAPTAASNSEPGPVPSTKQVFASSLSSASPPFYPSGSSNKETTSMQKRGVQAGNINRNARSADVDEKFSVSQPNTVTRGKNMVDSISSIAKKPSTSLQLPSSGSPMVSTAQHLHPRAQGRVLASSGQMSFQTGAPNNQVIGASLPSQFHSVQRGPVQSGGQPSAQSSIQQSRQFPVTASQTSSPAKAALVMSPFEHGESESPSESSKSKTALVGKGKGNVQASGKGSFMYGGAPVMGVSGNISGGHGDQNFAATPAFLPVMPFGGQHRGGIPAVGMAFPGYVAQPQLGLGNSEMTWLPVLAGAAGALGSAYGSPYIALDGAYNAHPSGQTSSSGSSSKEINTNKSNNEWKSSQRPDTTGDEFGQRQKNTRRYTEMNFGQ